MSKHPYRPLPNVEHVPEIPRTFTFHSVDHGSKLGGFVVFQTMSLPIVLGVTVAFVSTIAGILVFAVGVFLMILWWRRRTVGEAFLLQVDDGCLHVRSGARAIASLPLHELDAVNLDTKTIQRVEEGSSAIPAMRFADARVGLEVDTCRLVLCATNTRVVLGEKYIAHMDAIESLGKIRVFLRKNGWLPKSEREEES
jgi:hypothetical protein